MIWISVRISIFNGDGRGPTRGTPWASDQTAISANTSEKWRSNTADFPSLRAGGWKTPGKSTCKAQMFFGHVKQKSGKLLLHPAVEARIQQQNNYSCHSSTLAQLPGRSALDGGNQWGVVLEVGIAGGCPAGRICRIFSDKRGGKRDNIFTYNANFIPLQGKGEHTKKKL